MTMQRSSSPSCAPLLSVLVPFFAEDPLPLVGRIAQQARNCDAPIEIVLFDDGMPDVDLHERVQAAIGHFGVPVRLEMRGSNQGRARARNLLAAAARANWLLYLDADVEIPTGFLKTYLAAIRADRFDAACGGFSLRPSADADRALHAAMIDSGRRSEATIRSQIGATAFCTGNLLVRREMMQAVPFDERYSGWGWEDVDWAVSAEKSFNLIHIDNPIVNGEPQATDVILRKFSVAGANFAHLLRKHPDLSSLPSARAALILRRIPQQTRLRPVLRRTACAVWLPLRARIAAAKLWRASWAAEAI